MNYLENLLFPWDRQCICCGEEAPGKSGLCEACEARLLRTDGVRCERCGCAVSVSTGLCPDCMRQTPYFEKAFAPFVYDGTAKELISAFKFSGARWLRHYLARAMLDCLPPGVLAETDILVPVPLSESRLRERGYNQALLLAHELGENAEKPVRELLLRGSQGQSFSGMSREERHAQVSKLYSCPYLLHGETVLLADDVMTTGATLNECARLLLRAGAKKVFAVTAARTDLRR